MSKPNTTSARPSKPPPVIRGGFIVHRRGDKKGQLLLIGRQPYEHQSAEDARAQASFLAEQFGSEFAIFQQVDAVMPPERPVAVPPIAGAPAAPLPLAAPAAPASRPVIVERVVRRALKPRAPTSQGGRK